MTWDTAKLKKGSEKTVALPNGEEVKIRKVSPTMWAEIYGQVKEGEADQTVGVPMKLILNCCVEPKFALVPTAEEQLAGDVLPIDVLDMENFLELSKYISQFSGIDKLAKEAEEGLDPTKVTEDLVSS